MENELYEFAVQQFQFVKNQLKLNENGTLSDRGIQFKYEKIYPKWPVAFENLQLFASICCHFRNQIPSPIKNICQPKSF